MNELERADKEYEQSLDVPPSPYVWLMDSEFCGNCGTALSPYESELCYDCQQDEWYDEDQDFYDNWDYMADGEEAHP